MGSSNSAPKIPNNPIEVEQFKIIQRIKYEKQRKKELEIKLKLQKKEERKNKKKNKKKLKDTKPPIPPHVTRKIEETDYDVEAKKRMQDQLAQDSQLFLLNQLMLSIQFYGNYEK